ncbi:hypothetical protein U9M48_039544 [Paspalum notatum var. saurae]|uniref:Uncharacterized protein n=1 Tax=Paspalum notatum var. saurae TaxID=547442 RepID=A0AAQ3UNR3_PASNO
MAQCTFDESQRFFQYYEYYPSSFIEARGENPNRQLATPNPLSVLALLEDEQKFKLGGYQNAHKIDENKPRIKYEAHWPKCPGRPTTSPARSADLGASRPTQ